MTHTTLLKVLHEKLTQIKTNMLRYQLHLFEKPLFKLEEALNEFPGLTRLRQKSGNKEENEKWRAVEKNINYFLAKLNKTIIAKAHLIETEMNGTELYSAYEYERAMQCAHQVELKNILLEMKTVIKKENSFNTILP